MADHDLIVIIPFGDFSRGQMITDPATIDAVLASRPDAVVQVIQGPDDPTAPAPDMPPPDAPPPDVTPPPPDPIPDGAGTAFYLTVVAAFGDYNRGDVITDPSMIAAALADNPGSVEQIPPPT